MRVTTLALLIALAGGFVPGGASNAEHRAKTIAPYLDENTLAVACFDLSRPNADELVFFLTSDAPLLGFQNGLSVREVKGLFASAKAFGAREIYAVFNFALSSAKPVFVVPLTEPVDPKALAKLLAPNNFYPDIAGVRIGAAAVFGIKDACKRYQQIKSQARPEVAKAFAAGKDMTCQICVMLSPDARRAFEELIPTLPAELGGGSSQQLTRTVEWALISLDGQPKMALQGIIQARNETDAGRLEEWHKHAAVARAKEPKVQRLPQAIDFVAAAHAFKIGDKLTLKLDHEEMAALVQPLIAKIAFEEDRGLVAANLSKIAKAMHLYHDHRKSFPLPASVDKDGKSLLSWRVHLLPYLDQDQLYSEFKLDEPWDSQHNKKLIAKIPAVFQHPLGKGLAEGMTAFVVPIGKDTAFPGGKGTKLPGDFPDGVSQTVLVLEAADDHMVTWTKPQDWPFDPKQPHRGLIDKSRETFMAVFADASVHRIQNKISVETLKALITRNGSDAIGADFRDGNR